MTCMDCGKAKAVRGKVVCSDCIELADQESHPALADISRSVAVLGLAFSLLDCPDWGRRDAGKRLMDALGRCGGCGQRTDILLRGGRIHNECPGRPDRRNRKRIGLWTTRTTSSGRFEEEKRRGDVLAGVRKEDALFNILDDLTEWWTLHWSRERGT